GTLREFLQNIVDLSERAAGLTRQLLAFARKPALVRQPISLVELVRTTAELGTRTLYQVVEVTRAEEGVTFLVEGDGNQLPQAMVNLALNARDALLQALNLHRPITPGQAVTPPIQFRLRHEVIERARQAFPQAVPPGDYLVVEVEDR